MYCFDYGSCENCEWGKILQKNKRYRAKIRELKEDLRIEKHNHGVTKEFYNNSVANSEKIFAEQKAEIETLKTELRKECEEHEEFTKKAKAEIERLTEERENMQAVIFGLEEDKLQLLKRLDEEFVSLKAVKAAGSSPKAMKMLVESVGCVQKDTAKKFADLVEFHSIARMNDGVEYFTISALGLKEILVEEFGFKYSELNGVEVE